MEFSEFTKQYFKQFLKKLNKKYYSKGWAIYVPHRRTFNSALAILEKMATAIPPALDGGSRVPKT